MKNLTLVKLGGSLITDKAKPYTVNQDVIDRLAREIKEANCPNVIISHGQGSYGHQPAHKYQIQKGMINEKSYYGLAVVQDVAAQLNRIVVKTFIKYGINAMAVQPSCSALCRDGRIIEWEIEPIKEMLKQRQIPVPYGDVGLDLKRGCCIISADEVINFFARRMKPSTVLMLGKVDGVMTADPSKNRGAKLIPEINQKNFTEVRGYLCGSDGVDVTGGMLSKVESMLELAKLGITSEIINGSKPGYLKRALSGERGMGTIIRK